MKPLIANYTSSSPFLLPPSNECPSLTLVEGKTHPNLRAGLGLLWLLLPNASFHTSWINLSQLPFSVSNTILDLFCLSHKNMRTFLLAHPINPTSYFSRLLFLPNSFFSLWPVIGTNIFSYNCISKNLLLFLLQ